LSSAADESARRRSVRSCPPKSPLRHSSFGPGRTASRTARHADHETQGLTGIAKGAKNSRRPLCGTLALRSHPHRLPPGSSSTSRSSCAASSSAVFRRFTSDLEPSPPAATCSSSPIAWCWPRVRTRRVRQSPRYWRCSTRDGDRAAPARLSSCIFSPRVATPALDRCGCAGRRWPERDDLSGGRARGLLCRRRPGGRAVRPIRRRRLRSWRGAADPLARAAAGARCAAPGGRDPSRELLARHVGTAALRDFLARRSRESPGASLGIPPHPMAAATMEKVVNLASGGGSSFPAVRYTGASVRA